MTKAMHPFPIPMHSNISRLHTLHYHHNELDAEPFLYDLYVFSLTSIPSHHIEVQQQLVYVLLQTFSTSHELPPAYHCVIQDMPNPVSIPYAQPIMFQ